MRTVNFPPRFHSRVFLLFLNTHHLCPILVCEAHTDYVRSQATDAKVLARLQSEQREEGKMHYEGFCYLF